jgi:microcystin-dependent protein
MNNNYIVIIILLIFYILHLNVEGMANTDDKSLDSKIEEKITKLYKADIRSIRNLSEVSTTLQKGGLEIPGNLTVKGNFNYLPKGTIVAYTGKTAPQGWALCNGTNGTPDLRGRFIYGFGSGSGSTINRRGGAESHKLSVAELPSHNHSGSTSTNKHNHSYSARHKRYTVLRSCAAICKSSSIGDYGKKGYSTGNNSHSHSFTTKSTGSSRAHNNMPPYHVLAYIMKL